MEIAVLRDWIIVIFGFLGIAAIVVFITVLILIYRKLTSILSTAKETAETVRDASSMVSENVVGPIAKAKGFITGARKAAEIVSSMKTKKGGEGRDKR